MNMSVEKASVRTLWIFNHYAQEPGGPGSTRHFSLATHLLRLGWKVTIIASSVEHGTGRQRLSNNAPFAKETHEGVDFVWLRGSAYSGNGSSRIRNMLGYFWAALRMGRLQLDSPDVIIGSSVHPLAALAASVNAKRLGVPFVFEVRDLWPETLIAMGTISRNHPVARLLRQLERYLYGRASIILTLLPRADQYIRNLGISADKVRWLPNGVDVGAFPMVEQVGRAGKPFTFMYIGSHGAANALEPVLEAFALLVSRDGEKNLMLRMIGDGPSKGALIDLSDKLGIASWIRFEPAIPKHRVPAVAAEADAFVANVRDLPLYNYGISLNKLYDYLAAARPVIFASNAVNNPVTDAGAGPSISADNVAAIAQAMQDVVHQPLAQRIKAGLDGRNYVVRTHDYRSLAGQLSEMLESLLSVRS